MENAVIEIKNFEQKFKNFKISNINFEVKPGTLHVLIGESGSGKSVILKSIIGALPNYKGSIKIFGHDNKSALSKINLGFSTNLENFPNEMTAYKFLYLLGSLSTISKKQLKHNLKFLLTFFNLWNFRNKKLKLFSSGMKNRIMIIHSMITNSNLIILDEPGANLDYQNRVKFYNFLNYQRKMGKTIFLTTHMIDEIEPIIDNCTIVANGKMLYSGSYKIFTNQSDYRFSVSNFSPLEVFFKKNNINYKYNEEQKEVIATLPYNINLNKFFNFNTINGVKVNSFKEIKNDLEQLKIKLARITGDNNEESN